MEASNVLGNLEQEYVVVNTRYNTWTQIQVNYIMAETRMSGIGSQVGQCQH